RPGARASRCSGRGLGRWRPPPAAPAPPPRGRSRPRAAAPPTPLSPVASASHAGRAAGYRVAPSRNGYLLAMRGARTLLEMEIPPTLESVAEARAELEQLPEPAALEGRGDLELLVTELLVNSVRHAGLDDDEPIRLRVAARPPELHVEVRDAGPGLDPRVDGPPPS